MTGYKKEYILNNDVLEDAAKRDAEAQRAKSQKKELKKDYHTDVSSGIDVAIERTMKQKVRGGGKATRKMVIYLSAGQAYIQDNVTGKVTVLDADTYKTFWGDMNINDVFDNDYKDENGNSDPFMVWDRFGKSESWCNNVILATHSEKFLQLAKAGLMTISLWHMILERGTGYGRDRGWFGDLLSDEPIDKDIIKLVRYFVDRSVTPTVSRHKVLTQIYTHNRFSRNNEERISENVVLSFILIMSVYDINIAKTAVDMYVENPAYKGLKPNGLAMTLWTNPDMISRDGYWAENNPLFRIISDGAEGYRSYKGASFVRYFNPVIHTKIRKIRDADGNVVDEEEVKLEENGFLNYLFEEGRRCGYADILDTWATLWSETLVDQMKNTANHEIKNKYPNNRRDAEQWAYKTRCRDRGYDPEQWAAAAARVAPFDQRDDKWSLIAPKGHDELIDEAMQMINCVATYMEPLVMAGKTNIMFLRRTSHPDISVCSVEITDDGKVIQLKGYANTTPVTREQREALIKLMTANRKKRGLDTKNVDEYIRV